MNAEKRSRLWFNQQDQDKLAASAQVLLLQSVAEET